MLNQIMLWQAMIVGWARDRVTSKDDTGASLVEYALLLALDRRCGNCCTDDPWWSP